MSQTLYAWHESARVTIDAQAAGEYLEQLKAKHGGILTPEVVLAAARQKSSLLHSFFEWDDSIAAQRYREDQARYLVRNLQVTVIREEPPLSKPVRAFVHVERKAPPGSSKKSEVGYTDIKTALTDDELRGQVLRRALGEIKSWEDRYREYRELSAIFDGVARVREQLQLAT